MFYREYSSEFRFLSNIYVEQSSMGYVIRYDVIFDDLLLFVYIKMTKFLVIFFVI